MKKSISLVLLFFASLSANDLQTTISELITTNPVILERLHNYKSIQKNIQIAESGYYPSIDLTLAYGLEKTKKQTLETQLNVYQNSLTYVQNIFNGFQTSSQVKEEEYKTVAAAYSYIEKVNTTALQMSDAYIQLIQNSQLIEIQKENVQINDDIAQKVHKLYDAGLTTLSEVKKIESSLSLAKANLVVQENTVLDSKYAFKKVLGRDIEVTSMTKPFTSFELPKTQEEALIIALKNNPSILVSRFNIQLLHASTSKAKALFYPKIDIEVSQTMSNNLNAVQGENNRFRAMAYLSYNIFNGFSDSSSVQQSLTNIQKELQTQNLLKRQISEALKLSWTAKKKLTEQLVYLKEYRDFSLETLDLYSKEYDLGRRSLLDLLSAQNDFIKAKAQIMVTQYSVIYATYRILDAMGILVPSLLSQTTIYSNVNISNKKR